MLVIYAPLIIPLRFRCLETGVGCNADYDYEWLKTQDMYNSVLSDLNVATSDSTEGLAIFVNI